MRSEIQKEHWGDLDYEAIVDFCTFYMTCICGWKSELMVINSTIDSYQFQEKWRKHKQPLVTGIRLGF